MAENLTVAMLPAKEGDCIVITYGPSTRQKHVLIDAGRAWTFKNALKRYLSDRKINDLELLVVTHVDRDHIDGMLSLMQESELDLQSRNIWFNTWDHLEGGAVEVEAEEDNLEAFGAKMGEELSPLIVDKGWAWNQQFDGAAVELAKEAQDNVIRLGDLTLTLLSPTREKLEKLKPVWAKECKKAGIVPGASLKEYAVDEDDDIESFGGIDIDTLAAEAFVDDTSEANGSSIAFILEYCGKKLLLAGDAHADILETQLRALGASPSNPLRIDAFKIPHHGSKYNISTHLLELLDCKHFLVSTNGNYFKHPDDVAMARLIKFGARNSTIHFNYKTKFNRHWRNESWEEKFGYRVEFPDDAHDGYKFLRL